MQEYLQACMNKLENLFEQHRRLCYSVNITAQNMTSSQANNNNNTTSNNNNTNSPHLEMTPTQQQNLEIKSKSQSGTPTDVQDVKF